MWLVVLAVIGLLAPGGLFFYWLNWRRAPAPRPAFTAWWRGV